MMPLPFGLSIRDTFLHTKPTAGTGPTGANDFQDFLGSPTLVRGNPIRERASPKADLLFLFQIAGDLSGRAYGVLTFILKG